MKPAPRKPQTEKEGSNKYSIFIWISLAIVVGLTISTGYTSYRNEQIEKEIRSYLLQNNKTDLIKLSHEVIGEAYFLKGISLTGRYADGTSNGFVKYKVVLDGNELELINNDNGKPFLFGKYISSKIIFRNIDNEIMTIKEIDSNERSKIYFLFDYFKCIEKMNIQCISESWNEEPMSSGKKKPRSKNTMLDAMRRSFNKRKKQKVRVTNVYNISTNSVDFNLRSEITSVNEYKSNITEERYRMILDDNGLIIKLKYL